MGNGQSRHGPAVQHGDAYPHGYGKPVKGRKLWRKRAQSDADYGHMRGAPQTNGHPAYTQQMAMNGQYPSQNQQHPHHGPDYRQYGSYGRQGQRGIRPGSYDQHRGAGFYGAQSPEDIDMDLRSPPNAIDSYEPPLNPLPPLVENVYDTAKYRHLRRGSSLPASASSEPRASTAPGAAPAAPPAPPPPPPPAEEAAQIIAQASMNEPSFMFTAANGGGGGVVPMSVPEAPSPDYADSGMPIFPPGSTPFAAPMSPGAVPLPDTPMPGGMFSPRGSSFIPPSSSMLFDVGSLQQMPPPGQYTPHPSSMQHMFPPGAIPPSIMSPPPHMINPGGMPPNFMSPSQRMGPGGVPMSIMSPPTALPMMPSLVGMVPSSVVSGTMSSPDLSPLDHGPPIHIDPDHPFTLTSPHSVFYKKKLYRSAAHLFYSLMFLDTRPDIAEEMRAVESPHQVRYHALRNDAYKLPDWERIQHEVLDEALYQKFAQHVELRAMLLETGNQMLVNQDFRDHEWGVGHDGHGQNLLGHSLMRVRQRLMRETGRRDLGL